MAATLSAQEKHIFGVRAGLNVANMTVKSGDLSMSPSSKASFQIGGSYQYNFLDSMPFYLETGLYFTGRGFKLDHDGISLKANLFYLQIPVVVNYHWDVVDAVSIQPYVGLYYGFGVCGKLKMEEGGESEKIDAFKSGDGYDQSLKRSDLGLRFGVGVNFLEKYYAGLGYDLGLMDVANSDGDLGDVKFKNGCFFIQVGYKF